MKVIIKSLLVIFLSIIISSATFSEKGRIVIEVEGLRNSEGSVLVSIFKNKDYLEEKGVVSYVVGKVKDKQCVLTSEELPYGDYAIVLIHDENDNGEMDYNFMKIPKEGVGFSNNPKLGLSKPSYEETKFNLDAKEVKLNIKMKYF
ncbi:DUF2141 domain-containing protein [Cytophagaceae bacterium ABcell3]|nr:DUF2141 domain-containing protein [Cytophagaceae bacterium ABcell3]